MDSLTAAVVAGLAGTSGECRRRSAPAGGARPPRRRAAAAGAYDRDAEAPQRAFREGDGKAESLVGEALGHAERSNEELRELAHGILPTALSHGGLRAGVDAFAGRLDLSVQVDAPADRFPAEVEESAYFIVAEALTNVVKHSHAKRAEVKVSVDDELLLVEVHDDGIGGADPAGHGLEGLGDRATAIGGRLEIESPAGGGTQVTAAIPLAG